MARITEIWDAATDTAGTLRSGQLFSNYTSLIFNTRDNVSSMTAVELLRRDAISIFIESDNTFTIPQGQTVTKIFGVRTTIGLSRPFQAAVQPIDYFRWVIGTGGQTLPDTIAKPTASTISQWSTTASATPIVPNDQQAVLYTVTINLSGGAFDFANAPNPSSLRRLVNDLYYRWVVTNSSTEQVPAAPTTSTLSQWSTSQPASPSITEGQFARLYTSRVTTEGTNVLVAQLPTQVTAQGFKAVRYFRRYTNTSPAATRPAPTSLTGWSTSVPPVPASLTTAQTTTVWQALFLVNLSNGFISANSPTIYLRVRPVRHWRVFNRPIGSSSTPSLPTTTGQIASDGWNTVQPSPSGSYAPGQETILYSVWLWNNSGSISPSNSNSVAVASDGGLSIVSQVSVQRRYRRITTTSPANSIASPTSLTGWTTSIPALPSSLAVSETTTVWQSDFVLNSSNNFQSAGTPTMLSRVTTQRYWRVFQRATGSSTLPAAPTNDSDLGVWSTTQPVPTTPSIPSLETILVSVWLWQNSSNSYLVATGGGVSQVGSPLTLTHGTEVAAEGFNVTSIQSASGFLVGLSTDDTYIYVTNSLGQTIAYNKATKAYTSSANIPIASGFWAGSEIDGDHLLLCGDSGDDTSPGYVWYHNKTTGARVQSNDITAPVGFIYLSGLASDGTTLYVSIQDKLTVLAYNLSTRARDSSKDITLNGIGSSPNIRDIAVNNTHIYVSNIIDNSIRAYNKSTKQRDSSKDIQLPSGYNCNGLNIDSNFLYASSTALGSDFPVSIRAYVVI